MMDETLRKHLEEELAYRWLEIVSQEDLEQTYWEMQKEYAETLPDEELMQTAKDLGIDLEEMQ